MNKFLTAVFVATGLMVGAAQAATTIGPVTFDDNAFADEASLFSGTGNGFPSSAADGTLFTEFQLNLNTSDNATISFSFTDSVLFNGDGIDLVAFGDNNNGALRLTTLNTTPTTVLQGELLGTFAAGEGGSQFGGGIWGWDLSDFGFAVGEAYSTGLGIGPEGNNSRVYDIAALNSRAVPTTGPSPVPLPAGVWLMLTALGGLGFARRKS